MSPGWHLRKHGRRRPTVPPPRAHIRWRESERWPFSYSEVRPMEADEMPVADIGDLDPRTPLLVGVGQVSERLGQPGYRRRSPVDLAADAARAALADSGADPAVIAAAIHTLARPPQ